MFEDELEDLELVYKSTIRDLHEKVEDVLPSLLYYMEEFLSIHKQNEAVREKLDVLLEKMGREETDDVNGGDEDYD